MASIRENKGALFFDFRYQGKRCREYTKLEDTPANRKTMQKVLNKIEAEMTLGTFAYSKYFPGSKNAAKFAAIPSPVLARTTNVTTPLFAAFANTWFDQFSISWRRSHMATVRSTLDRHLIPFFGEKEVGQITRADVLNFRTALAKVQGRNGNKTLSNKTINRIVQILRQILHEAANQLHFSEPVGKLKYLRVRKPDVFPFTIDQVWTLVNAVRADYRDYLIVRFFTAMRSGELNGLKRKYVDFDRRQILIRESIVLSEDDDVKTEESVREIDMSQPVYDALKRQMANSHSLSEYVFCNSQGHPIDLNNFTNRVWYPLLRHVGLEKRRPYQTRHTTATLWLAAGENPEWIARQMGHANTEMLFKTYSRYVPNLTRRDGSAFNVLVSGARTSEVTHAD